MWKQIKGFSKYQVNERGEVKSTTRKARILKQYNNGRGSGVVHVPRELRLRESLGTLVGSPPKDMARINGGGPGGSFSRNMGNAAPKSTIESNAGSTSYGNCTR